MIQNYHNEIYIEPALLTIEQTYQYLNLARATFYKLNASGAFGLLPVKPLGCRKVLYSRIELEAYVKASTAEGKFIPRKQWQNMKHQYLK